MNIQEALSYGKGVLQNLLEAEILLSYTIGEGKEYFFKYPRRKISDEALRTFQYLLETRQRGKPVAYITRKKEFFGREFYIDERCFIPRPETELLVELAIQAAVSFQGPRILDIGTGSGIIAVSLAKVLPQAKITAVDISENALEVAKWNVDGHGVRKQIELLKSDLLEAVAERDFEIIVANLPYIGKEKFSFVEKEVMENEPEAALYAGNDGLDLYRKLFEQIREKKRKGSLASLGCLIGEFGFQQRKTLTHILNKNFVQQKAYGCARLQFFKDLAGIDRAFMVSF